MRTLAAALAVVALGALAGCGNDGSDVRGTPEQSPASSPASAGTRSTPAKPLPACADVWKAGKVLPLSYRGCVRHGDTVAPSSHSCSSGQRLDRFGRHYYAARGARVQWVADLDHDAVFRRALESCSG
jgi:hypothetical protein